MAAIYSKLVDTTLLRYVRVCLFHHSAHAERTVLRADPISGFSAEVMGDRYLSERAVLHARTSLIPFYRRTRLQWQDPLTISSPARVQVAALSNHHSSLSLHRYRAE